MTDPPEIRMRVEDTFTMPGRGLAVTGRPEGGTIRAGDRLWLSDGGARRPVTVRAIERGFSRTPPDGAYPGENCALILGDDAGAVASGMWLSSQAPDRRTD